MAETTRVRHRQSPVQRTVPVPGYALDPDSASRHTIGHHRGRGWHVVGALVQALLVVLVIVTALATVIRG